MSEVWFFNFAVSKNNIFFTKRTFIFIYLICYFRIFIFICCFINCSHRKMVRHIYYNM